MGYVVTLQSAASQAEGSPGGTAASFTFKVDRASGDVNDSGYRYEIRHTSDLSPVNAAGDIDFTAATGTFDYAHHDDLSTTFTITANPDIAVEGNDAFQVWVYSGASGSPVQRLDITLNNDDNGPPVFATADTISALENTTAAGTIAASGPNGAVAYAITGGDDAGKFAIDSATGALTFTAAQDFEAPGDANHDGKYKVDITATSGGATTVQHETVVLANADEAVTIDGAETTAASVPENTDAGFFHATASDIDAGDTVAWSIVPGGDGAAFQIDANGDLSFVTAPNFEAPTDADRNNTYDVTIKATDSGGLSDTQTVKVTVTDVVAEAPVITSNQGGLANFIHVQENTDPVVTTVRATDQDTTHAITYDIALGSPDVGDFVIDHDTGVLKFASPPNFELPADEGGDNLYIIDVTATSAGGIDTQRLYITVDNVIEPGVPSDENPPPPSGGGGGGVIGGGGGGGGAGGGGVVGGGASAPAGGDDIIVGSPGDDSFAGGEGNDVIIGNDGADSIDGDNGDDVVGGGAGSDFLRGLNGNDSVYGDDGNDTVNGNMGNDSVMGGAGSDTVYGGQGNDTVSGGDGDDGYVNGNIGQDIVHGDAGNDSVYGGQGDDTVYGDDGNDLVSGDLDNDILFGGAGADKFAILAGGGMDYVADFNAAEGDRVLLAPGQTYTVTQAFGQVMLDLGGGTIIVLAGAPAGSFSADWIVHS